MGKKKRLSLVKIMEEAESDFVDFGPIARNQIGMQAQYASRYVSGGNGYPNLGNNLRFLGDPHDYHFLKIHKDDIDEFVKRVKGHLKSIGVI